MDHIDCLVIGSGVIGLAIARVLAQAGREVIIAEREILPGAVTTARNSGVIHAGIYYPPGSAKARLCVRGRQRLYEYACAHHIPHKQCGKLIVACTPDEVARLQGIKERAAANGATDLVMLSRAQALEKEPQLACEGALFSPSTGIIDAHELVQALLHDAQSHGAVLACGNEIDQIAVTGNGFVVDCGGASFTARNIVNAAGLAAQHVAQRIDGLSPATIPPQYLARGHYFSISGAAPFAHLVYPLPVPGGLGAHYTMNMAGQSLFGPDVEWLPPQDIYNLDYHVDERRASSFVESVRRYWPDIVNRPLQPAYSGIRPKLAGPGAPDGDFIIQGEKDHGIAGLVNLYGIESPGLTASLAIADEVAVRQICV